MSIVQGRCVWTCRFATWSFAMVCHHKAVHPSLAWPDASCTHQCLMHHAHTSYHAQHAVRRIEIGHGCGGNASGARRSCTWSRQVHDGLVGNIRHGSEQDGGQSKTEVTCQRKAKWSGKEARQTPGPMRDIISAPPARPQPCGVPPPLSSAICTTVCFSPKKHTQRAHKKTGCPNTRWPTMPFRALPRCPSARLLCRTPLEVPPLFYQSYKQGKSFEVIPIISDSKHF